jgi:hypothetical protein
MGQNLVLNMNDHGFKVAVFNRTVSKVDDFLANEAKGTNVVGAHSIQELVGLLKSPRRVMLMVKAGDTVDQMIDQLAAVPVERRHRHRRRQFPVHRIRTGAPKTSPPKESSSSAPAFPAAKKALASVRRSCQAAIPKHGRM